MTENGNFRDVSELRKVARVLEQGKEKIGRGLTREEIQAGLDALWNDAGVEDALAVIERVARGTLGRNEVTQLFEKYSEVTGSTREKLLSVVQDSILARLVNELYRPNAVVGDGGTADMLIYEFYINSEKHLIKAKGRITEVKRLIASGKLGLNNLDIAEALLNDLEYAVSLFK